MHARGFATAYTHAKEETSPSDNVHHKQTINLYDRIQPEYTNMVLKTKLDRSFVAISIRNWSRDQ